MAETYIAIDLKSFYASVECVDRGLDPMRTHLVVADDSRTDKTICLAVSPALKAFGIPGRPRLFEVVQKVAEINAMRRIKAPGHQLKPASYFAEDTADPLTELTYITARPRMSRYMEMSTQIFEIYMKYVAPEDIHVYSVDEIFADVTHYLYASGLTARQLTEKMIDDVFATTGITATAGIGTNLYLCKIAMDMVAKRMPVSFVGARIAELNEDTYRRQLWEHTPLTDFWRIGHGTAARLEKYGMRTMGDVALCSLGKGGFGGEDLLYKLFGVNAELLIDHAWGRETCTMADIKAYVPASNSLSSGQVLQSPYPFEKAKLIVKEMTDLLVLDLVRKGLVTDQIVLQIGYDTENVSQNAFKGEVVADRYGRFVPKPAHGSTNLGMFSASGEAIIAATAELFDRIADPALSVRRINVTANHVLPEGEVQKRPAQLDIFSLSEEGLQQQEQRARERRRQQMVLGIRTKFGKNAILKGMNLEEGATARERNKQIGGHKA